MAADVTSTSSITAFLAQLVERRSHNMTLSLGSDIRRSGVRSSQRAFLFAKFSLFYPRENRFLFDVVVVVQLMAAVCVDGDDRNSDVCVNDEMNLGVTKSLTCCPV